jgi:hypothetical protein
MLSESIGLEQRLERNPARASAGASETSQPPRIAEMRKALNLAQRYYALTEDQENSGRVDKPVAKAAAPAAVKPAGARLAAADRLVQAALLANNT